MPKIMRWEGGTGVIVERLKYKIESGGGIVRLNCSAEAFKDDGSLVHVSVKARTRCFLLALCSTAASPCPVSSFHLFVLLTAPLEHSDGRDAGVESQACDLCRCHARGHVAPLRPPSASALAHAL